MIVPLCLLLKSSHRILQQRAIGAVFVLVLYTFYPGLGWKRSQKWWDCSKHQIGR